MFDAADFALAVRRLRGSRNQNQVARAGGVDESTWSLYENAKRVPRKLTKVARGLGCTVDRLREEIWLVHRERIAAQESPAKQPGGTAGEATGVTEAEPLERGIDEHVSAISHHLKELILLTQRKG